MFLCDKTDDNNDKLNNNIVNELISNIKKNIFSLINLDVDSIESYSYLRNLFKIIYISQDRGLYNYLSNEDKINSYSINSMIKDLHLLYTKNHKKYQKIEEIIEKNYNLKIIFEKQDRITFFNTGANIDSVKIHQVPGSLLNMLLILVPVYKNNTDSNNQNNIIFIDEIEMNMDKQKLKILYENMKENQNNMICINTHDNNFVIEQIRHYVECNIYYCHNEQNNLKVTKIPINYSTEKVNKENEIIDVQNISDMENIIQILCCREEKIICVEGIGDKIYLELFIEYHDKNNKKTCNVLNLSSVNNVIKMYNYLKDFPVNNDLLYMIDQDNKNDNETIEKTKYIYGELKKKENFIVLKYDLELEILKNSINYHLLKLMNGEQFKAYSIDFNLLVNDYYESKNKKNNLKNDNNVISLENKKDDANNDKNNFYKTIKNKILEKLYDSHKTKTKSSQYLKKFWQDLFNSEKNKNNDCFNRVKKFLNAE